MNDFVQKGLSASRTAEEEPVRLADSASDIAVAASVTLLLITLLFWRRIRVAFWTLNALAIEVAMELFLGKIQTRKSPDGLISSFPSGHTATIVIVLVVFLTSTDTVQSVALFVACALFTAAVGFLRMLALEHSLSDVVGGVILGLVISFSVKTKFRAQNDNYRSEVEK